MDTRGHMQLSSVCTFGRVWGCKNYKDGALQKVKKTQFEKQIFEPGVQPMEFVSVDLIGEFHPPWSKVTGMH